MFEQRSQESFPKREERILDFWKSHRVFEESLKLRKDAPLFSTYDGPPFATGLPHYGHILAGTIKDVVPRYKTMKGFFVPRRFGWDCHGLPVENEIEKSRALSGSGEIEKFGIAEFNEECRSIVLRYTSEWKRTVDRMGRWVSFEDTYRTMDRNFMESVWWVFAQLYEKGLVYEGFKVMPFSARLGTPISNFEANLNYKEVDDPSLTVQFTLKEDPDVKVLVWTTTPWTLPSNLAIMAKRDMVYVKVRVKETGQLYILAETALPRYFISSDLYEVVQKFRGEELDQARYEPLLPYFADQEHKKCFRIILEEEVSSEEGTGLVHAAPAFGEVDFYACFREKIDVVCPVDSNGRFTEEVPDLKGVYVKDADKEIIKRLKKEGKVFHHGQVRHRYPFCWRSDTPLIYKAVRTWFVAVEKVKEAMLACNAQIHWVPDHIQQGRFGKWLENARDWAISRNRYWGTPIPIWRNRKGDIRVISSITELEEKTKRTVDDIHRHLIDDLIFEEDGEIFYRIPEVFDCWFESGSMPYAQNHFPFENTKETMAAFPADFIAEGLDQTRGWFYTLTVLAAALFDKPAFKNVIVNGILLAEDGNKMSKRLKNYPEPDAVFNQYGADAVRLYLLNSPAVQAEDLRFSERGVELVLRQVLIPFWNSYIFFSTYAEIYSWKMSNVKHVPEAEIDQWILSLLQKLISDVSTSMDSYNLSAAVTPFVSFIEELTNWYIRRSRSRFWSEKESLDREEAFATLYTVLITLSKIAAPFIPFLSEAIYQALRREEDPISVHLCNFPEVNLSFRQEELEKEMRAVQQVVSSGHALRKEHKIKVRQPLSCAHVVAPQKEVLDFLQKKKHLIAEELNVKNVVYHSEESSFVALVPKPNFRLLGKKVGKKMNAVHQIIAAFGQDKLQQILAGEVLSIEVEGESISLSLEDIQVERKVLEGVIAHSSQGVTVALDTALTPELVEEGLAREIVNKINLMRKEQGFAVTDRIFVEIQGPSSIEDCFRVHQNYICNEILARTVTFVSDIQGDSVDLNGELAVISIRVCPRIDK